MVPQPQPPSPLEADAPRAEPAVALPIELLLHSRSGLAWADGVATVIIAAVAIKEGIDAWLGDACAGPVVSLIGERAVEGDDLDLDR